MDEPFNGDESLSRKRRRVELGKKVATNVGKGKIGASKRAPVPVFMADTILVGMSP